MSARQPSPGDKKPHTQQFRRAARPSALSPEQKRRQAVITDAAWRRFGQAAPMMAFLNSAHDDLIGRPLDIAVDSDAGLNAVLVALTSLEAADSRGRGERS